MFKNGGIIVKKSILTNLISMFLGALIFGSVGFAAGYTQQISVDFYPLKYYVNNVEKFPKEGKGFVYKDTAYVPLRFISEVFDSKVDWDEKNFAIKINNQENNLEKTQASTVGNTVNTITRISSLKSKITDLNSFNISVQRFNEGFYVENFSEGHRDAIIDYYLNKDYTDYSGYFGIYERLSGVDAKAMMVVKGDDKELFRTMTLRAGDFAQPFSVNVTGVNRLTLEFYSPKQKEKVYSAVAIPTLKKLY
jgi:hypothetical protein